MLTRNRQVGMFCFFTGLLLFWVGYCIWKKEKTDWIPGYKYKVGEDTPAYCTLVGKGVILVGVGLFILSVPLSLENPDKIFALSSLISCLFFVGMGVSLYLRAEKHYHS